MSTRSRRGSIDMRLLERMRDVLAHRGPDDSGVFIDDSTDVRVGMGHRRLSIVDLAAGHQPMTNEDGSLVIVYNGEIYNHSEIRPWLESRGHSYRTVCDTETILHLYEEEGERVVDHLRGMFAFAIWDRRRRELFVARDRLGVKPLYYVHTDDGSLYFASEIKALLAVGAVVPELNYGVLPDYLANRAPTGEETLFRGVHRLLPGHTLRWHKGEIKVEQYWEIPFDPVDGDDSRSDADYIEEWNELFHDSVRLRLMADVPLGVFLSGGVDSSAIAAVMSQLVDGPVKTFSVACTDPETNELDYARLVARAYKTEHYEVVITPDEFLAALPRLVWHEDEPLAGPASVPLYFVSRLASQHVKVVLTGEGSDELLGGYERYRKTLLNLALGGGYYGLTSESLRRTVRQGIASLPSGSKVRQKLTRTFLYLPPDIESIYFDNFAVFSRGMQNRLLTAETKERTGTLDPYANVRRYWENINAATLLNRLLYVDTKTYLHELLMKQDQMSMAASIESRVPFLDHQLVELSARLPEAMKLRGWTTKYILRQSMKGMLPEPILRRPKMGFPVPVGQWFRGHLRGVIDEYVLSERATSRGLFDKEFVHCLVEEHQLRVRDHSDRLWALVNMEMWLRQFIDSEEASELPCAWAAAAVVR